MESEAPAPLVSSCIPGLTTATGLVMSQGNDSELELPNESVAVTTGLKEPTAFGVPVISPVEDESVRPVGKPVACQVTIETPDTESDPESWRSAGAPAVPA